jgi:hypothetical protein
MKSQASQKYSKKSFLLLVAYFMIFFLIEAETL